jgi:hypothetical protein
LLKSVKSRQFIFIPGCWALSLFTLLRESGQMPYPKGMTYIDDGRLPLCTEYLPADLNQDCFVDFGDLAELAQDWLQNTLFESGP